MFNIKIICFVIDILISKQFYKFIYVLLVPIGGIFIIGLSELSCLRLTKSVTKMIGD